MTKYQALSCSHQGRCDDDVECLVNEKNIKRQISKLNPADICAELKEYGAWEDTELSNDHENLLRIFWVAACNIKEGY